MKFLLLLMTVILIGCGNSNVAGNSSETGNCRIVGVASFSSALPADSVPVVLAPADYIASGYSTPDTVWTNEKGEFLFDIVEPGEWTISIVDQTVQEGLIRQGITLELGDSITITGSLEELGTVKINRVELDESAVISIVGTPWNATLPAGESSILIPSLPTDEPISIAVQSNDRFFVEDILVQPADTVEMSYEKRLLVLHGAEEEFLYQRYKDVFATAGFASVNEIAETGDVNTYSEYDVIFLLGYPELNSAAIEFLLETKNAVVTAAPMTFPQLNITEAENGHNYGVTDANDLIFVSAHDIVVESGLENGSWLQIVTGDHMSFGRPLTWAENLATIESNTSSGLFVYDSGDSLSTGVASGKRIGIFANGFVLTESGEKLLASTLKWAAKK